MPPSDHEDDKVERLRRAMYSRSLSPNIKERERRELDRPDQVIGNDFVTHEASAPKSIIAPRGIGYMRRALLWFLGIAILFFVLAVGYFSYYFLFGPGSLSAAPGNISIAVSGPPQIEGGQPTELQISVVNRNNAPLELADLVVTYPPGTRSPADFTSDLHEQRISLGTIESGGQRQGTVTAVFSGNAGDTADVKVELEYRMQGSNAIFVSPSQYTSIFSSSPISLAIDGNNQTISGQPVQLVAHVAANTNAPVRDALVSLAYPFGFKFSSADPAPDAQGSGTLFWQVGDLVPGQTKNITINGTMTGTEGDDRVFKFTSGTRTDTASKTIDNQLAENEFHIAISQTFLGLSVSVNGATGQNVIVTPGENVVVAIAWQNNLSTPVSDAVIAARLSGLEIDGTTVHTTDGFYRSTDDTMLWDKTTSRGELQTLAPGSHGTVSFSFQMPSADTLKNLQNPHLAITINAAGRRTSETGVPENLQATASAQIAVASDIQLLAQGLYYSNPFGSTGPMPAKAGTETTYAVVFNVTNSTNKITNAKVTAHLPPYVRWVGIYSPSSEKVSFNQLDGTVTWDLGDIDPNAGLNGTTPRQAAIAIGFTPSTSQIGQEPSLIEDVTLSGTDASTGGTITKTAKDVTTNISGDPGFTAANAAVVK